MRIIRSIRRNKTGSNTASARRSARRNSSRGRNSMRRTRRRKSWMCRGPCFRLGPFFLNVICGEMTVTLPASGTLPFASLRVAGRRNALRPYMSLVMGQGWFVGGLACLEGGEAIVDLVPVDYVPPGREIFGATVVVFQIVGMLPNIIAEDGIQTLRDGIVLIWGGDDLHFAAGFSC